MDKYSYISNAKPVYKLYKWILICFCAFLSLQGCIVSKKEAKNDKFNYYTPVKTWEKTLASLHEGTCEYIIFDAEDTTSNYSRHRYDNSSFRLMDELINLQFTEPKKHGKTALTIEIKKGSLNKIIKIQDVGYNVYDHIQEITIYKIKTKKDELTVIKYDVWGGTGKAINWQRFIAIDKNYNTYVLWSYTGEITCFGDLDGKGDINFLEINLLLHEPNEEIDTTANHHLHNYSTDEYLLDGYIEIETKPSVLRLLEDQNIAVYSFAFVKLKDGKTSKENPKYSKLGIINCNYKNYIKIHRDSILDLRVNPCLEENISIRREIEKYPSPIID